VATAVAVLATGTILTMQNLADAGGCSSTDGLLLRVAADPAIAPVLREVAAGWTDPDEPEVNGRCVAVEVTGAATAEVASMLATSAGGLLDIAAGLPAAPSPAGQEMPAVWIPDSSYWIDRMRSISRSMFEPDPPSLATSPVLLGVSAAGAGVLGSGPVPPGALREPLLAGLQSPDQPPLPFALPEPRRDTAGLVGAAWTQSAVVTSDLELPFIVALFRALGDAPPDTAALGPAFDAGLAAAPMSEQAVVAHNTGTSPTRITAVRVVDAPVLDFPYAVLANQPRDSKTAAAMFRAALTRSGGAFARHGFRAPDGTAGNDFPAGDGIAADPVPAFPVGPPERFDQARRIWTSATSSARVLSVVGVNASMQLPMTMPDGSQVPRLRVFQAAATQGMEMFRAGTDLGHWEYAARLDGDRDWVEGVPIALLDEPQQQRILAAIQQVRSAPTNESALFETVLAAYRVMKEGWDPTRSNTLVVWTDSGSTKQGGMTLEEALRELERLADLTRPIRVILLGLGPDADMAQLEALAAATGGGAFQIENPADIQTIFLRALLALPPVPQR
jgi:hypothetical protein